MNGTISHADSSPLSLMLTPDSSPSGDHFNEGAKGAGSPSQTGCGPPNWHGEMAECSRLALFILPREKINYMCIYVPHHDVMVSGEMS